MNPFEKYFDSTAKIQQPQEGQGNNDFNEPIITWADVKEVIGRLRPLSGEKRVAASKETAFISHRFYCSYFSEAIPPGCTLLLEGNRYNIKFIQNVMMMDRLLQLDLELIV